MISGIDEAGRGCIIGPMVFAIASIEGMEEFKLKALGVKDSKKLSPAKREELFLKIQERCKVSVSSISATEITRLMDTYSLNEIEAQKIGAMLNKLGPEASVIYVDSPDNIPENFTKRIRKYLNFPLKIVSENKADDTHPIVAAASIMAKVTRDGEIEKIKKIMGEDFGSGYTSDERTIYFLSRHLDDEKLRPFLRTKWKTIANLRQKKLSDY